MTIFTIVILMAIAEMLNMAAKLYILSTSTKMT